MFYPYSLAVRISDGLLDLNEFMTIGYQPIFSIECLLSPIELCFIVFMYFYCSNAATLWAKLTSIFWQYPLHTI